MTMPAILWGSLEPMSYMSYGKFSIMMECVVCRICPDSGVAFLRCGHFVCNSYESVAKPMCLRTLLHETTTSPPAQPEAADPRAQHEPKLLKYKCPTCHLVTTSQDIENMKLYSLYISRFHRDLSRSLNYGEQLKVFCDACGFCYHAESEGRLYYISDNILVCSACSPPQFLCNKCIDQHIKKSKHLHAISHYDRLQHEWMAMYNCAYYLHQGKEQGASNVDPEQHRRQPPSSEQRSTKGFAAKFKAWTTHKTPSGNPKSEVAKLTGEDTPCISTISTGKLDVMPRLSFGAGPSQIESAREPSPPPPPSRAEPFSKATLDLIDDILITIELLKIFKDGHDNTVKELTRLLPGDDRTISEEKIKTRVAVSYVSHLKILQTLVYLWPDQLDVWKPIFKRLSLPSLTEFCFQVWEIPLRETGDHRAGFAYVVPWYTLSSAHPLGRDLRRTLCHRGLDVGDGMLTFTENVVNVSITKFNPAASDWGEDIKKTLLYIQNDSPEPNQLGWLNVVKLADNLFAVSTVKQISLVRRSVNGHLLEYKISPDGMGQYGHGLWWNGKSLFAISVGTMPIAVWDFEKSKNSFIVHFSLQPIGTDIPFFVFDTLVGAQDELCFCYGGSMAVEQLSAGRRLHCCKFPSGKALGRDFPAEFYMLPASIARPMLVNMCNEIPDVIIRDDNMDSPVIYAFSYGSWFKIDFRFFLLNPPKRAVVKDVWFETGRLCLKLETYADSASTQAQNIDIKIRLVPES